jgi:hypothetical protein
MSHRRQLEDDVQNLTICDYLETLGLNTCDCTSYDYETGDGSIICSMEFCDILAPKLCGRKIETIYFEGGNATGDVLYCLEMGPETFCANYNNLGDFLECQAATMNGCDCTCEYSTDVCKTFGNITHWTGTCPNNVSWDFCNGLGTLFGNKVPVCGNDTTTPPANSTPGNNNSGSEKRSPMLMMVIFISILWEAIVVMS